MFRLTAAADHLPVFNLETALERCAWTDVIHVVVDGAEVYRDEVGLGSDLVPVFDVLRATLIEHFTPFEVVLGRREGDFEVLTKLVSTRFQIEWTESIRDLGLDRGADEEGGAYLARLRALLADGYLLRAQDVLRASFLQHLECVRSAGLQIRPDSLEGPWLQLRGDEPDAEWTDLHAGFGDHAPPLETERALLHLLLSDLGAPDIPVKVDHYGEVLILADFRDVLVALGTPPPDLPIDAEEDPR
jgi:hypothetical protein